MNKTGLFLIGGLLIVSLYMLFLLCSKIENNNEMVRLLDSMEAEMLTYKDNDSLNNAKIQILETANKDFFIDLKSKDSTIQDLQRLVSKYKKFIGSNGSATILKSETKFSMKSPTIIRDTVNKYFYPVYESELNGGKWAKGRFFADKDTVTFDIKFINEYEIVQGEEKRGWFKPSIPTVKVKNLNPYTETKDLKTYRVYIKPKRWGIGPSANIGINSEGKLTPTLGVGLQYNLIQF